MKTLLLSVLLVISIAAFGQAPGIQWQKTYGGSDGDILYAVAATTDGGSIMAGSSNSKNGDVSGNHGNNDYWVVKANNQGVIEWQKSLGGSSADVATSIQQTSDGGYIVAGVSNSNDGDVTGHHGLVNYSDYWVVKLTSAGDIQWQKSLGGTSNDNASSIQEMVGGGGYIVVGSSGSYDGDVTVHHGVANVNDVWVVRLNATGQIVWQKTLGGSGSDDASSIKMTPDGGFIISASTSSNDGDINGQIGDVDWWIIKIYSTGGIQWQKRFGGSKRDGTKDIQLTPDGGYIATGYTYSSDVNVIGSHGIQDMWVLKLSSTGALQWQKCLGGSNNELATSVRVVPGGYIVAGYTESNDGDVTGNHSSNRDYWVVKLNSNGGKIWQKAMGGTSEEMANNVALTPGGGLIVVGSTYSNDGDVSGNHGMTDGWVVRLTSDSVVTIKANTGNNICVKTKVTFTASVLSDIQSPVYQWKKNNVNVGTNAANYTDSLLNTGDSVFCIVTSPGRADTSNAIRFTTYANYQPTIKVTGSNSICDSAKITYTAVVTNAAPVYHLQWKKNNINVGSDSLEYTTANLQNGDSVWCVVTSITGCTVSPVAASNKIKIRTTANVLPNVIVAATPAVYRFCSSAQAIVLTFHASIKNGGGTPAYQWKKNGVNAGANSAYYTDSIRNGDSVWCVFTSSAKCVTINNIVSNRVKITITAPVTPTVTVTPLPAGTICLGTPVRFKASAKNGGGAPHYQWKKNNANVGTDSDTYNDSTLLNNDSVWCVFTSNAECAVNNPATSTKIKAVVTNAAPLKPSAVSGPASVTANQQAIGYAVSLVNNVSYVWSAPAGCAIVSGQGTNQIVVNWGSTTGSIIVRAKNACGQSDSSKLLVHVVSSFSTGAVEGTEEAIKKAGKEGIQLYPNPAVNTAYISFSSAEAGKYFMQLTDAQGRILQSKETIAVKGVNKITLNVAAYAQGVYFIKLAGANKQQQSFRFLIQR